MAASIKANYIFMVVLRVKARYRRSLSAYFSGFKLASSTHMLSILGVCLKATSHKHSTLTTASI